MLSGPGPRAATLSIDYARPDVECVLRIQGQSVIEGAWRAAITLDGREIPLAGEWEAVCWNSDEDADYLELQLQLGDELLVNRQFVLARGKPLAIVADVVVAAPGASQAAAIEYSGTWALSPAVKGAPAGSTREARVRWPAGLARLFPLALSTDGLQPTPGSLEASTGRLTLSQGGAGRTLYAPLVIDSDPRRRSAPAAWRRLTVTEERRPVPPEAAAAYRLQVGADQWLVYHRLQDNNQARAFLGHHTWNESVIGEFRRDGSVRPYILVE